MRTLWSQGPPHRGSPASRTAARFRPPADGRRGHLRERSPLLPHRARRQRRGPRTHDPRARAERRGRGRRPRRVRPRTGAEGHHQPHRRMRRMRLLPFRTSEHLPELRYITARRPGPPRAGESWSVPAGAGPAVRAGRRRHAAGSGRLRGAPRHRAARGFPRGQSARQAGVRQRRGPGGLPHRRRGPSERRGLRGRQRHGGLPPVRGRPARRGRHVQGGRSRAGRPRRCVRGLLRGLQVRWRHETPACAAPRPAERSCMSASSGKRRSPIRSTR